MKEPKKALTAATEQNGSQVKFYYGMPTPYAESIALSLHPPSAHYNDEGGREMPKVCTETYMKSD
jgi:hypothetical protein